MPTPRLERLWSEAMQAVSMGHLPRAVERLRQILSDDPGHAEAHALLSMCLVDQKRIVAGETEARIAVGLDPSSPLAHRAMAHACTAQRKFPEAEEHYRQLLHMAPEDDAIHRDYGELLSLAGRRQEAEVELNRAVELAPDEPDNLSALGTFLLSSGRVDGAERLAHQALELTPSHLDALVLMGRVALRRGDVAKAREHAHWALALDATDLGALHLMAAIKAKTNWFLGLWWRYSTWTMETGNRNAVVILLIAFIVYRVAQQLLADTGNEGAADLVRLGWLGLCVYTWVGPGLFQRELEKELGSVRLRDDF